MTRSHRFTRRNRRYTPIWYVTEALKGVGIGVATVLVILPIAYLFATWACFLAPACTL